jgi:hypothetical protein
MTRALLLPALADRFAVSRVSTFSQSSKADQPGRFLAGRKNRAQGGACGALGPAIIFPRHESGPFFGAGDRIA